MLREVTDSTTLRSPALRVRPLLVGWLLTVGVDFLFNAERSDCEAGREHILTIQTEINFKPYANVKAFASVGVDLLLMLEIGVRAGRPGGSGRGGVVNSYP